MTESNDDFGIPVHEFDKGPRKRIRLHVQEYRGVKFLDIREFYLDRATGSWRPSPKGITVQPHLYSELLSGIVQAAEPLGVEIDGDPDHVI